MQTGLLRVVGRRNRKNAQLAMRFAAAGGVLVAPSAIHAADTPSNWIGYSHTGLFADKGNWSTSPNYPNNTTGTNAKTYAATISLAGTYGVNLLQSDTLDTLTLNDAGLSFNQSAGTFIASSINVSAGVYTLYNGSTLAAPSAGPTGNLNVTSAARFNVSYGTISNYNLSAGTAINMLYDSYLYIRQNMNSGGGATINMNGSYQ